MYIAVYLSNRISLYYMKFEDFLQDFGTDIHNHQQFLFNAILAAILSWLLSRYYIRYGNAISNRRQFANNFMLLALSTMLIIYIVKSSIALSLGLVGALSIVRFRAAIKEPEELVYLFLVIGIGLGMGANQTVITLLAFILIMALLFIRTFMQRKTLVRSPENMFVNISANALEVEQVNQTLAQYFSLVELKRLDQDEDSIHLSYIVECEEVGQVIKAKNELIKSYPQLQFSFIEQRNLAL